jgi:hypothetical protein
VIQEPAEREVARIGGWTLWGWLVSVVCGRNVSPGGKTITCCGGECCDRDRALLRFNLSSQATDELAFANTPSDYLHSLSLGHKPERRANLLLISRAQWWSANKTLVVWIGRAVPIHPPPRPWESGPLLLKAARARVGQITRRIGAIAP